LRLIAPLLKDLVPLSGSLAEPGRQDIGINGREYHRHGSGVEQLHALSGIGTATDDRQFSAAVRGTSDALSGIEHVRMAQVIDVPEIHRQIVHPDMQHVDAVDGSNGIGVADARR
jgi:hypothetical protein